MISVIVPTYNSEKTIEACIKSLLHQSFPKKQYEIIIVDDGSKDKTSEIVSKYPVKLFKRSHRGPAAARNFGAEHAKGKILMFTDADCVPDRNWIRHMAEPFKDEQIVGVSGTYKTLNKNNVISRFAGYEIEERHKVLKRQRYIDFIGTFSAGYRRSIFLKFGGFDTRFRMASGEDPDLSFKINKSGGKMVFQSNAYVYHNHPDTIWRFLRQKFWRGYWRVPLYKKHRDKMFRHSYTPKSVFLEEASIALIGFTFLLLTLSTFGAIPSYFLTTTSKIFIFFGFLLFLSGYLCIILSLSSRIYDKDKEVGLWSPFIIILRDSVMLLGILYGIVSNPG